MENERKVVGTGETVYDILFRDGQPVAAVAGGSCFNSIISVGRAGVPCSFVGYTGADEVGRRTVAFLRRNGVDTAHFLLRSGEQSAISLAFLGEDGDATYSFYRQPLSVSGGWTLPRMNGGDVLIFGSYFAACPAMQPLVRQLLEEAVQAHGIVYYDINFRRNHQAEREELLPAIRRNISRSTIVRGSTDDFDVLFGSRCARDIYKRYVSSLCPILICTSGAGSIVVCTPQGEHEFQPPHVENVVSTVGAGDSFNAGMACALIRRDIMPGNLCRLGREDWQQLVATACGFAAETCRSTENYIARRPL